MAKSETVICLYRVKRGNERKFAKLLERHWPTLRTLGLVTRKRARHFHGAEKAGEPLFVEIFEWTSGAASERAHEHPEVAAIWEPMDALCESRDGKPNMEFPRVQPLEIRARA